MSAARLHAYREPLRVDEISVPRPAEGQVLVRVLGAGFCHSDLHIIGCEIDKRWAAGLDGPFSIRRRPLTGMAGAG